jgi:hypothetical protein
LSTFPIIFGDGAKILPIAPILGKPFVGMGAGLIATLQRR